MKIIALQGVANAGKSTVLRIVAKMVMDKYGTPVYCNPWFYTNLNRESGDIRAIFKINGKTIAITSRGDGSKLVRDDYEEFKKHSPDKIDLYICAMHDTPNFRALIKELSRGDADVIAKKPFENEKDIIYAKEIFDRIEDFIG